MEYQPHQQRVIDEHKELTVKLNALASFFDGSVFAGLDEAEQVRLRNQARFMSGYQHSLMDRIQAFMQANAIGQRGAACGASAAPTGCASNGSEKEE